MAKEASKAARTCTQCGGETTPGHLVWNGPIRFKPDGAGSFSRGTAARAYACTACGHIQLWLET